MHHHDHTWHRTSEGENSSVTATASDLQQHLDQGLLTSHRGSRNSPGINLTHCNITPILVILTEHTVEAENNRTILMQISK